jgi:hypothetical protein
VSKAVEALVSKAVEARVSKAVSEDVLVGGAENSGDPSARMFAWCLSGKSGLLEGIA